MTKEAIELIVEKDTIESDNPNILFQGKALVGREFFYFDLYFDRRYLMAILNNFKTIHRVREDFTIRQFIESHVRDNVFQKYVKKDNHPSNSSFNRLKILL